MPRELLPAVDYLKVAWRAAKRLQVIPDVVMRDHVPLQLRMRIGWHHQVTAPRCDGQRWDTDALMEALKCGTGRRPFLADLETAARDSLSEIQRLCAQPTPDAAWQALSDLVRDVAARHFGRSAHVKTQEAKEHERLLAERRSLREHLIGAGSAAEGRLRAELREASLRCRRLTRQAAAARRAALAASLDEALRVGRPAEAHRLARQLAGTGSGPGRRTFMTARLSAPLAQEWVDHLAKPGCEGGMSMYEHAWDEMVAEHLECSPPLPWVSAAACALADSDLSELRVSLRRAPKRRAVPPWSAPLEVWWMAMHPGRRLRDAAASTLR